MQIIRPITTQDLSALKEIAVESGHGFTSLPIDGERLNYKILKAQKSFGKIVQSRGDQSYLFVLEDTETNEILGTTGIEATVGISEPIYHYHQSSTVHHSLKLGIQKTIKTLSICNDYTGASEVCTLFVRKAFRNGISGQLLSRVRYLFMANNPQRFSNTVIAEMRGFANKDGSSPFWGWLQESFFDMDFSKASHLVGMGEKSFIAELMPRHPIYVNLLSTEAQACIGKVHEKTAPALHLLKKEGFSYRGYVDLFDAGPTVEASVENIRTIKESKSCATHIEDITGTQFFIICNNQVNTFRAAHTNNAIYDAHKNLLTISTDVAANLLLNEGDSARFILCKGIL